MDAGSSEEDGVSCWTVATLHAKAGREFGRSLSPDGLHRTLRGLGFRRLSPRPVHPGADPGGREEFRSGFSGLAKASVPERTPPGSVDIWFRDEARTGRKGMLSRVWALRGTRPRIPCDHRYGYRYPFATLRRATETAVGHIRPRANTTEMNRHLQDIGGAVPEVRHTVVVSDGAGWHRSRDPIISPNVSLLHLPPYGPEPSPAEQVFPFLKRNHLSNRVFATADHVMATVGDVWNRFIRSSEKVKSINGEGMGHAMVSADAARRPAYGLLLFLIGIIGV